MRTTIIDPADFVYSADFDTVPESAGHYNLLAQRNLFNHEKKTGLLPVQLSAL